MWNFELSEEEKLLEKERDEKLAVEIKKYIDGKSFIARCAILISHSLECITSFKDEFYDEENKFFYDKNIDPILKYKPNLYTESGLEEQFDEELVQYLVDVNEDDLIDYQKVVLDDLLFVFGEKVYRENKKIVDPDFIVDNAKTIKVITEVLQILNDCVVLKMNL